MLRFDPFRDFDRVLSGATTARASIPMDVTRSADHLTIHFDLPGVEADDVDLTVERRRLVLEVERHFDVPEGVDVITRERPVGRFSRELQLGEHLDPDNVEATFRNGVLSVTVPVASSAQPRKVAIGGGGPAIEADAESVD